MLTALAAGVALLSFALALFFTALWGASALFALGRLTRRTDVHPWEFTRTAGSGAGAVWKFTLIITIIAFLCGFVGI